MPNDQLIRDAVDKAIADIAKEVDDMLGIRRVSHDGENLKVEKIKPEDFYADNTRPSQENG